MPELNENWTYKVVQMYFREEPVIAFDAIKSHAEILEQILTSRHIAFRTENHQHKPVPVLRGDQYRATGMGFGRVFLRDELSLYGISWDYELGIDKEHALLCEQKGLLGKLKLDLD